MRRSGRRSGTCTHSSQRCLTVPSSTRSPAPCCATLAPVCSRATRPGWWLCRSRRRSYVRRPSHHSLAHRCHRHRATGVWCADCAMRDGSRLDAHVIEIEAVGPRTRTQPPFSVRTVRYNPAQVCVETWDFACISAGGRGDGQRHVRVVPEQPAPLPPPWQRRALLLSSDNTATQTTHHSNSLARPRRVSRGVWAPSGAAPSTACSTHAIPAHCGAGVSVGAASA